MPEGAQKKKRPSLYLRPEKRKIKPRKIATYDIESKKGTTQRPGMTRPFLACLYDGKSAKLFRDSVPFYRKSPKARSAWRWEHLKPRQGCIDKLCRAMFSEKYDGFTFVAHNGGTFDHLFLLPWLAAHRDQGFDFTIVPVASAMQQVRVTRSYRGKLQKWTLLDSLRLLPMSLQKATETFGLTGKDDLSLETHEDDPRWDQYNARDCMALAEVMERVRSLMEDVLGGEVGITAPSSSMKLFRRKYQKWRIPRHAHFDHCPDRDGSEGWCDGCCHDFIRKSYVGGRTEIFEMAGGQCRLCGGRKIYEEESSSLDEGEPPCPRCADTGVDPEHFLRYYDINSSYVAALCEPMPVGERVLDEGRLDLAWKDRGYVGFCECEVVIPDDCEIPPLPKKDADTGKLVFPRGRFSGIWDVDELALLDHPRVRGKITWIGRTVWFRAEPIFREMMEELWRFRDKKQPGFDEGLSALAKLLGNGLYGKFAQALEREEIVFRKAGKEDDVERCMLCGDELREESYAGPTNIPEPGSSLCTLCVGSKAAGGEEESDVWYRANKSNPDYVIPQISAHVTSLGRIRLWLKMIEALDLGGRVFNTDSITADRTVIVKSPEGEVVIAKVESLWERSGGEVVVRRGKEVKNVSGWEALSSDGKKEGWFPLRELIRHAAGKDTWLVTTKDGQTEVTGDHGIMVEGKEARPEDFVRDESRFTKVRAPKEIPFELLDLFEHLKSFELVSNRTHRFEIDVDPNFIRLVSTGGKKTSTRQPVGRMRRFYPRGSKELHALLRLVGSYTSDGSASLPGTTTKTRFMLSFCKSKLGTMERIVKDMNLVFEGLTILGPFWSDTTYIVRSGTVFAACVFAALAGVKSRGKRFPSFVYKLDEEDYGELLKSIREGDSSFVNGQWLYTTNSAELAAGISYLYSQHETEHSFWFREEKGAWLIRTRDGAGYAGRNKIYSRVRSAREGEYVYDLSVEGAHTFVDGIGRVLLHNTDSIITDVVLPSSGELGALKDEFPGKKLAFLGVQPKVYMLTAATPFAGEHDASCEKKARCSCKSEACDKCHGCAMHKVTFKGVPKSHRNRRVMMSMLRGKKTTYSRLEKVRSVAARQFAGPPRMVDVDRSIVGIYGKRVVCPDGKTVPLKFPLVMDPAEEKALRLALDDKPGEPGELDKPEEAAAE